MVKFRDSSSSQSASSSSSSESSEDENAKRAQKHKNRKHTNGPQKPREKLKLNPKQKQIAIADPIPDPDQNQITNAKPKTSRECKLCRESHYAKNCPAKKQVPDVEAILSTWNNSGLKDDKKKFTVDAINLHEKLEKQRKSIHSYRSQLERETEICDAKLFLIKAAMEQVCKECPLLTEL